MSLRLTQESGLESISRSRPPLRWAIVGCGQAASRFAFDLNHSRTGRVHRIAARDTAQGQAFASKVGPRVQYGTLDDTLADRDVDAIYVASPASCHLEHALSAIEADKPVLIEKPIARYSFEVESIMQAAEARRVLTMEAMWMCFTPGIVRLREMIRANEIGNIVHVSANLSYAFPPQRMGRDPSLSSALLDLGVYPVWLAYHLLGVPLQIGGVLINRVDGSDVAGSMSLAYRHATAALSFGFQARGANSANVVGERGVITVFQQFLCPPALALRRTRVALKSDDQMPRRLNHLKAIGDALSSLRSRPIPTLFVGTGLHYQADHFAALLTEGLTQSPIVPLSGSLAVARMLEEVRIHHSDLAGVFS